MRLGIFCFGMLLAADAAVCRHEWVLQDHIIDYLRPADVAMHPEAVSPETMSPGQFMNSLFPGPAIECQENDDVEVLVVNNVKELGTAIHWHGMHMNNEARDAPTPWNDGVHHISSAPIMPGQNYTYRFKAWPPGTHFWHSHVMGTQVDRGVRGPIVIRKAKERYAELYSEEKVIFMSDSRQSPMTDLFMEGQAMAIGNPVASEIRIATFNGLWGNGSVEYPYPQIEVEQGKCYRFRWINGAGNVVNYQMRIAAHTMKLIALDGNDIQPMDVVGFNMHAGERVDAVFCADQEAGNYLISATYDIACPLQAKGVGFGPDRQVPFIPNEPVDACEFYAFIKYRGHDEIPRNKDAKVHGGLPEGTGGGLDAPFLEEDFPRLVHFDLDTHDRGYDLARNVDVRPEPAKPDYEITLYAGVLGESFKVQPGGHHPGKGRGQFGLPVQAGWGSRPTEAPFSNGGRTYLSERRKSREFWSMAGHWPSTPALFTKGGCGTNGANIIDIPEDAESVEITIVNLSPIAHSFHLHGMYFQVVNYGYPEWCNRKNQWVCFFLPYLAAKAVAHETIGGKVVLSDPKHPDMGGPFYWGIEPNKDHPNYKRTLNLEAPLRKDVIGMWMHQWAVIRIKPNNPGMWPLHCHVEHHIPTGMVAALNIKPSLQPPIPLDTPMDGSCPVNGWPHRQAPEPKKITTSLDVYDWVVDYQRPTREGKGWFAKRLNPNEIEPNHVASLLLANGSFPGAPIEVTEGDLVTIQVNNYAFSSALTVHWHGLAMSDTPWSDGAYGVTQGALAPMNSYNYSFRAAPAGTHMFVGATDAIVGARGLKGALIVRPRTEPRAHLYDEEMTMHISDSWQTPDVCLGYDGVSQLPQCPPVERVLFDGMWGDGGIEYPLPVYKVKKGHCYRWRIMGAMSQVGRLNLTIEGHTFKLLAVDGTDVVPVELSSLALHAGERYDVLLCAEQSRVWAKRRFEITASAAELCDSAFLDRGGFPAPQTCLFRAMLEHVGGLRARGSEQLESSSSIVAPALDLSSAQGYDLVKPLESPPVLKGEPDASFELTLGALSDGRAFLHSSAMPWSLPSSPLLFTQGLECSEGVPLITVPVEARDIELTVRNSLVETQAIHLHGPRFQLVAVETDGAAQPLETPILRDTVAVPGGGAVVIRVSTAAAGMWALEAMSANLRHRGAATALSVRASEVLRIPSDVPVQGPCVGSEQFV